MSTNTNKTVLIVEDEEALANILAADLKKAGYEVLVSYNGEDGLKSALEHHPTLILLDIVMPKKDGLAVIEDLHKMQKPPLSHVIFLTNLNDMDKVADAVNKGADGYFIKAESSLAQIVEEVNNFFQKNKAKT